MVRQGRARAFGLITTNSLTQVFNRKVVERHLSEKDTPLVLSWAIAGYVEYEQRGMDAPAAVTAATDGYMRDMDAVARFITDCCLINPHAHASIDDLFARWSQWVVDDGAEPLSKRLFGDALTKHGYPGTRRGGRSIRTGIGVQTEGGDEAGDRTW